MSSRLFLTSLAVVAAIAPAMAADPIRIGVPVGLSGANSVVAPSVVQSAELAVEEINAKGGVLGRPLGARRRRRRLGRRRRTEGVRRADLPEEGQCADLDGDERGAQRRPADRGPRQDALHLHLVLRRQVLQPLSLCERLGAGAAGAADRRLLQQGEEGEEILPDRIGLRLRPRHAVVHQGLHREDGRQGRRRGISADGRLRLDVDHLQAEGIGGRCDHHVDGRRRAQCDADQAAARGGRQSFPTAISRSTKARPRAWARTPPASISPPPT